MHPRSEQFGKLQALFQRLLAEASFQLLDRDRSLIEDFLEHDEFGVAFDTIIDAIREDGIPISETDFSLIRAIGNEMNLEPDRWRELEPT